MTERAELRPPSGPATLPWYLLHDAARGRPRADPFARGHRRRHGVLTDCDGNVSQAARLLGIHRRSLQRKLSKYPVRENP